MTAPKGRREASKEATRAALLTAATRLFGEQGYDATTVADIAAAANVTQRTFYRYFDGKEDLVAGEYRSWLDALRESILGRPAAEPPLTAVREAMLSAGAPVPLWLFSDRPFAGLRRTAGRPLVRFESAVTAALLARQPGGEGTGDGTAAGDEFRAQVIARVTVAVFRSAAIRQRELHKAGDAAPPSLGQLLGEAFAALRDA